MGQTLTHGVYLPDEGERNCYSGLAANWQILDTSVGTIAAHTSALSGKAPLVHTHTKSDVTDLLNSNFIPSANNSYDLGSSSYQWNNFYAKNYFYNGTAWGLDKANVWSAENTFISEKTYQVNNNPQHILKCAGLEIGVQPANSYVGTTYWFDKNNNELGFTRFVEYNNSAQTYEIRLSNKATNGVLDPTGSVVAANIQLALDPNGVSKFNLNVNAVRPVSNGSSDLGDSTHKWKSINGVNPGALSIPEGADSGANSSFTPDTTDWPKDGTAFQANMPIVGWLRITIKNVAGNYAFVRRGTAGANLPWQIFAAPSFAADFAELTLNVPVTNATYTLRINSPGGFTAKVYPCLGNV